MLNQSFSSLPMPELFEQAHDHSFKSNSRNEKRTKKPPKLYPKEASFIRNMHRDVHAISFREYGEQSSSSLAVTSTPKVSKNKSSSSLIDSLSSSFYDKHRNESYFEQCFETITKLGEGSFGEVFKARCKDDGKLYAIKKTKQMYRSETYRRERLEEVKRYEQFSDNEHCVTLYKAWEQEDLLYMQIELCSCSVQDYVMEVVNVPESFVWSFLFDMLLALKGLHDKNLVHLDIKLDNVLMTDDNHCKLADFGLVFDLTSPNRSRAIEGDSRYLAPELMQGNCCLANDIYSLGISVLELSCNLELPTNGFLWQELRSLILPDVVKQLSSELQQVIRMMMEPDPLKRPTVDQLLDIAKLRELRRQRKIEKISEKFRRSFNSSFQYVKSHLLIAIFYLFDFFKLDKTGQKMITTPGHKIQFRHTVENCDEHSDDDEISFRTSLNSSRLSKISRTSVDDDNNNENVTPTLNNSIPRVTPDVKIIISTPLNHHEGLSHRKYRRDLTKSSFELGSECTSPVFALSSRNISQERDPHICKKLYFNDYEDLDEL